MYIGLLRTAWCPAKCVGSALEVKRVRASVYLKSCAESKVGQLNG